MKNYVVFTKNHKFLECSKSLHWTSKIQHFDYHMCAVKSTSKLRQMKKKKTDIVASRQNRQCLGFFYLVFSAKNSGRKPFGYSITKITLKKSNFDSYQSLTNSMINLPLISIVLRWFSRRTSNVSQSYEPRRKKTGLRGFKPGPTQTGLCSHRKWLEA